jgi:tol-pal system protein YbgF
MNKILIFSINIAFVILISLAINNVHAEEEDSISAQINSLKKDIKTLEKAVYSQDLKTSSSTSEDSTSGGNDTLTKHLLKLSELEEQFQALTNNFEEINFKLDKLSSRISKVQSDNQMRFQDLENGNFDNKSKKVKKLPGSSEASDLGGISDIDLAATEQVQQTQSIESAGTIITEKAESGEKILPNDLSPSKQYEFAVSFIKVGDYETAELALREFVDTHPKNELAGNAQYWYGETFRVRQLYQDAATAYLDGYQKYPKSKKAPVNLLKLGVMLVQIGEKEQGCSMILGIKEQYPKASQSVIQKAEYEKKKFSCKKNS